MQNPRNLCPVIIPQNYQIKLENKNQQCHHHPPGCWIVSLPNFSSQLGKSRAANGAENDLSTNSGAD